MKYLYLFFIILFFSGCNIKATYKDVTSDKSYSKVINNTYKTLKPITITANLVDNYKSNEILSYGLGIHGSRNRYILWNKELKKGTIIKINKVFYANILFGSTYHFEVNIDNPIFKPNIPINLYEPLTIKTKNGKHILLSHEYFEEIK